MKNNRQHEVTEHFERLWQQGITPWKEHGIEPALEQFFRALEKRRRTLKY